MEHVTFETARAGEGRLHLHVRSLGLERIGPLLLALPTLLLAMWVIVGWKFNGLYGQDPFAYYDYGVGPLRHSLLAGAPLTAMFWPLGYPIVVTFMSLLVGTGPIAGQVASTLATLGAVVLTYLLGRDLFVYAGAQSSEARRGAALGALLVAVTGRIVESSAMIMADSVALATALLSAWALVRWQLGAVGACERATTSGSSRFRAPGALRAWSQGSRRRAWPEVIKSRRSRAQLLARESTTDSSATATTGDGPYKATIGDCACPPQVRPGWRQDAWLALAGAALGWSIVTRWGQGILVVVWLGVVLSVLLSRPVPQGFYTGRILALAVLPGAAIVGTQLWLTFTVRPVAGLGRYPFAGDLGLLHGAGWSLAHLFQRSFLNDDGLQRYASPNLLFYASGAFRAEYLTPLFAPFVALGLVLVLVRYRRALLLLVAWPAAVLLFDAGLAEQNPRFVLAALPPIALLAGLGLAITWNRLAGSRPVSGRLLGSALLASGLLVVAAVGLRGVHTVVRAKNSDLQVTTWAAMQVPPRAGLLSFGITLTLQHTTQLDPTDLYGLSRRALTRLIESVPQSYLLVQVGVMDGQMRDQSPGVDYRFLRDSVGLVPLGTLHGYTLFRIAAHRLPVRVSMRAQRSARCRVRGDVLHTSGCRVLGTVSAAT